MRACGIPAGWPADASTPVPLLHDPVESVVGQLELFRASARKLELEERAIQPASHDQVPALLAEREVAFDAPGEFCRQLGVCLAKRSKLNDFARFRTAGTRGARRVGHTKIIAEIMVGSCAS